MIIFYMRGHEALDKSTNPNNIEGCDNSGERAYPGELVKDWKGNWVLPWHKDQEPYPEFEKIRPEASKGALRPEKDSFITELVTADDL